MGIKPKFRAFVALFLIIIIFLPIGVNKLMNTMAPKIFAVNGVVTSNDWIGFMGSFLGSLIAGILTLGGVYLTIREQRFSQVLEKFPSMLLKIDEIKEILHSEKIYGLLNASEDSEGGFLEGNVLNGISNLNNNRKILLSLASEVNPEIYLSVKNIVDIAKESIEEHPRKSPINSLLWQQASKDEQEKYRQKILKVANARKDTTKKILEEIKSFDVKYNIFIDKYNALLGE